MKQTAKTLFRLKPLAILSIVGVFGIATSVANAEILYDGANTSGVTTDDQYVIDYDDTSTGNISLNFGSAGTRYLRFDTVNGRFQISNNLDLQSNQLINARIQNVAVLGDVPSCAVAGDRGKQIYTGAATIPGVNGAQTLSANSQYVCNDTNLVANRWVAAGNGGDAGTLDGLDSTEFLRSNANTSYTGIGNTLTFANGTNVVFNTNSVALPGTTANTFTVNNDAANGDSSVLTFGDGTGTFTFNDTTGVFTANNSLTVNGTATANSLVVNSGGSVNLNNNQVQNLREENVAVLPAAPLAGRRVFLTANDTTAPGCSVSVPCTANDSYFFNGTKWVKGSADGSSATLEFSPEYADGVIRPDGSANVGTMIAETDTTNNRNFYRWNSNNLVGLQDIDVVVDTRLPADFGGFAATNALQYDIRTTDTVAANQKLDLSGKDTAGAAMTISGTVANIAGTVANTWQTNSHNITGGAYVAGSRVQLTFHISAFRPLGVQKNFDLGNFRLNYIRKSP